MIYPAMRFIIRLLFDNYSNFVHNLLYIKIIIASLAT